MKVHGDALPSGPNDFNLYSGLIALGVGLFGCLLARYSNGGRGPRPTGDALSWLVHTRLGPGPKSFLGKQLDLGVLLTATYGELLIVSIYIGWLTIRFAVRALVADIAAAACTLLTRALSISLPQYYLQHYSESITTAVRVGKAFGRLGPPMILMSYLLAQRCATSGRGDTGSSLQHKRLHEPACSALAACAH